MAKKQTFGDKTAKQENKKENIYSNIDEMLSSTLKSEDQE